MKKSRSANSGYDGHRQINLMTIIGGLCSLGLLFCVTLAPKRPLVPASPAPLVTPGYLVHLISAALPATWHARAEAAGSTTTWRSRDGLDTVKLSGVAANNAPSEGTPQPGATVKYEADSCGGYLRTTTTSGASDGKMLVSQGYDVDRGGYKYALTVRQVILPSERNRAQETAMNVWKHACSFL